MKLLVDVSLSPQWVNELRRLGVDSVHWSAIGELDAPDRELLEWAHENEHWLLTLDLDFGAILAVTAARGPSVIQLRAQDVLPERLAGFVVQAIQQYAALLEAGALLSIDDSTARARILPLLR